MKNLIYPAVFHKDEDGTYTVTFPDLDGCLTYGSTPEEAALMAGDALFAWLSAFQDVPAPSDMADIKSGTGDFVQLVRASPFEKGT